MDTTQQQRLSCWLCWLAASPYLGVVLAWGLWWASWSEIVVPSVPISDAPIEQELLRLDEGDEQNTGLQVTLIPAPNFAQISLSEERKQSFIAWMLPLISQENERIRELRQEAVHLYGLSQQGRLSLKQKEWLINVATDYEVNVGNKGFDLNFWQNLLYRVDTIPPSLVLTQAAVESGWGTSRLAKDVNNYFGIMCFSPGCGVPYAGVGEFRRFANAAEAVSFYMRILNTKGAYRAARSERMRQRLVGDVPSGVGMAKVLHNYSELGSRYIGFLLKIMHENRLDEYDGADSMAHIEMDKLPTVQPVKSEQVSESN